MFHVVNPGGAPFVIDDVDAFIAGLPQDRYPLVDVGGEHLVPLIELIGDQLADQLDAWWVDPVTAADLALLDTPGWEVRL